jgi:predicted metal-dependent peptidase
MIIKNIHEKLLSTIQTMLIDTRVNLPYYGEFNLFVNFHEVTDSKRIDTCAVNVTSKGMQFYYNPKFLERMSQKESNFIVLHEDFHLLFNHPKRTVTGGFDHKLSNIAQDMIINHVIWEDINHNFVEIPKDEDGKNMALFIPKEYKGKLIFEEVYEWLREEQDKWKKKQKSGQSCQSCGGSGKEKGEKGQGQGQGQQDPNGQGDGQGQGEGEGQGNCPDCKGSGNGQGQDSSGNPSYGPYGKNPGKDGETIDTWSMDQLFDNLENNQGQYLDQHLNDDVPEELREAMIKDTMDRLQARGLASGNMEATLNKLRKQRKDYLKEIKRSISSVIFGTQKQKTIVKPNRRQVQGLKGNRKIKTKINCILDTSGSMGGTFERVLSYIYRNDIEVNLIEADTNVKWIQTIKSKRKLESLPIKGLGGTVLQPAIDLVADRFNEYNTVVLTDGYCDSLDLSKIKGKILMISIGTKVPITRSNGKVKQIMVEKTDN